MTKKREGNWHGAKCDAPVMMQDIFRMNQKQLEGAVRRMWSDSGTSPHNQSIKKQPSWDACSPICVHSIKDTYLVHSAHMFVIMCLHVSYFDTHVFACVIF